MWWRVGLFAAALVGGIQPVAAQTSLPQPPVQQMPSPQQPGMPMQPQPGTPMQQAPMQQAPLQQAPLQQAMAPASVDMSSYTLGPGDRVRIIVFNEPSLSGEYGITDEGQIVVSLVGPLKVAGKTPIEAGEMLRAALAGGYLNDPKVSLEVLTYRPFYILGEVGKPGAYPYTNDLTITQAIAFAGGYSYRANRRTVFLKRKGAAEIKVKVRTDDQVVKPGDVIRVGERYF